MLVKLTLTCTQSCYEEDSHRYRLRERDLNSSWACNCNCNRSLDNWPGLEATATPSIIICKYTICKYTDYLYTFTGISLTFHKILEISRDSKRFQIFHKIPEIPQDSKWDFKISVEIPKILYEIPGRCGPLALAILPYSIVSGTGSLQLKIHNQALTTYFQLKWSRTLTQGHVASFSFLAFARFYSIKKL